MDFLNEANEILKRNKVKSKEPTDFLTDLSSDWEAVRQQIHNRGQSIVGPAKKNSDPSVVSTQNGNYVTPHY